MTLTREQLEREYEAKVREVNPHIGEDYDRMVAEEYEGPYGPDGSDGSHIMSFVEYIAGAQMNPFDLLDDTPPLSEQYEVEDTRTIWPEEPYEDIPPNAGSAS